MTIIKMYDCWDIEIDLDKNTIALEHKEKAQAVLNEINKYDDPNKGCLPPDWLNKINRFKVLKFFLACPEGSNYPCGVGPSNEKMRGIIIPEQYENPKYDWQEKCGCEEYVILEEIIHAYAAVSGRNVNDHNRVQACAIECTKEFENCKEHKPKPPKGNCKCK